MKQSNAVTRFLVGFALALSVAPALAFNTSQTETVTTYSGTPTFDFSTFKNTRMTLTGNISSITCTNQYVGAAGEIRFIQDGTGSRTLPGTFGCNFKFPFSTQPVLSTTASAIDTIVYYCTATNYCIANLLLNIGP